MKYRPSLSDAAFPPGEDSPVRIGVLGCSDIARRRFIPALAGCSTATLAAISSRSPEKAAAFAPDIPCELLSHADLLASPHVDLVYLSLPNHLHEEWAIRALQSGKHVICEKPLGLSPDSVELMLAIADANRRLLYENLMFLHHPQHAVVREIVSSGRIGRVRTLRAVFTIPFPKSGDFRLDPAKGGGSLHDQARYPLGAALYHLGAQPRNFRGHASSRGGLNLAVDGTAVAGEGEIFSYSVAFGRQYQCYYEMVGEKGLVHLERAFTTPPDLAGRIRAVVGSDVTEVTVPPCDHFGRMIDDVATLIAGGGDFSRYHDRSRLLARLAREMEEGCHG
ncbi:MAG TPA: Gfo/Idh/MocA family oxidoreductase [Geobacteraceae bacterium]|nr:Gfo/Idh/MocA family oxidoreductase [Geobacteraceae bacterium]